MHANNMIEPAFPNDGEMIDVLDKVADLRAAAAQLSASAGPASRDVLAPLLRAMNSYYTNKIEGQHTYPADLEAAIERNFSKEDETYRRQQLAIAHMRLEKELEPVALQSSWAQQFSPEWICRIHRELYMQLPEASLIIKDARDQPRGKLVPGALRDIEVTVGNHRAPPVEMLPDLLRHFAFRYGVDNYSTSRKVAAAGAALHRLSWIHPFADGNGRVSRLQNHLLLTHLKLTDGLWSPMRGLARRQADYYAALGAADNPRRNDTDGRGNLSSSGLTQFLSFWLDVCIDQVAFMSGQLSFATLEHRFGSLALQITHDFGRSMSHSRNAIQPEQLGRALYRLFQIGRLERGEFKAMLVSADRTASRAIAQLLALRLVKSASRVGPLEPGLPFFSLRFLFPGLWPEADGVPVPIIDAAAQKNDVA
ncbi:Fic family protein [Paraburkholderia sp. D15]|uniref:Fic family protein n=1 Tax=Paraburkholderia sp. D15 TaxID=2880218 RepID=UPI00247ADAF7|nr:Fic family protein [Paraburkholderia sp. D15]WGS53413.1 Fic family protein [Paraburkholderia sp. D15]